MGWADGSITFPDCPGDGHHCQNEAVALFEGNEADRIRVLKLTYRSVNHSKSGKYSADFD
jgi:hypothetical protein